MTMDAFLNAGLKPANHCEIGGNPSGWKVKELTKLILRQPRMKKLAVIMNFVSNTRVDLVARGVIKGVEVVVRPGQEGECTLCELCVDVAPPGAPALDWPRFRVCHC